MSETEEENPATENTGTTTEITEEEEGGGGSPLEDLSTSVGLEVAEYAKLCADADEEEETETPKISYIAMLDAPRELPEPVDLTAQHLKDIENELGLIKVCWPEIINPEFENRTDFPRSYLENNKKERLLLLYAENFRRQFSHKFPDRRNLFLASDNECGMQKMVCTTLRPTTLPYPEIETWQDCATFVGNQLIYEPLEVPTLIPKRLYSPHTTFLRQSGHSYELATALCSLLLGLGYDAYVVSGYATRDTTLRIMSRVDSPYPIEEVEEAKVDEDEVTKKYAMKPPRDLRSKFLLMMEQREVDKVKAENDRLAEIERERMEEEEKPPYDEFNGLRVHAWVFLGKEGRKIDDMMFIEPSTGLSQPLDSPYYCGIESVWNNVNYWVNMQDCREGLGELDYDFSKVEKWEHLLIGEPVRWRKTEVDLNMDETEIAIASILEEKHLDVPTPWSMKIYIPHSILAQKFPNGIKKTYYKRTLVEEYAPYVQEDGLVTKITRFKDFECTEFAVQEELYENRHDNFVKRIIEADGTITEFYNNGREDAAIKHSYFVSFENPDDDWRIIEFNHQARWDSLLKMEIKTQLLTVEYADREDFLYYRQVSYARKGSPPQGMIEGRRKIITDIVEKFRRNKELEASQNVAVREFALIDREIHLKYHYGDGKVTASTRDFIKPPLAEMGDRMKFNPELTFGYQAEVGAKPPRQLQLFLLLEQMLKEEEIAINRTRDTEDEIDEFLLLRSEELAMPKLDVSLFNREQNEDIRLGMLAREKAKREHEEKEVENELDFLAPYLAKLGNPEKLSFHEALLTKEKCLTDFKQLLLDRANYIQKQFEMAAEKLQEKQNWYQQNQDLLPPDEVFAYAEEINDLTFLIQTYEVRLARHRELSFYRYENLAKYLLMHPALSHLVKKIRR